MLRAIGARSLMITLPIDLDLFLLYASCPEAIKGKFENSLQHYDHLTRQGMHFAIEEIQQLQNKPDLMARIPPPAELL